MANRGDCSASLRGAFFATKQSPNVTEIASQTALAMTEWLCSCEEILNLQSKGSKSKPYQVKQVRNVIVQYKLGGSDD